MNKKIVFLGPNGSYSHLVALKINEKFNYELLPKSSFQEIHKCILENKNFVAILPFENSITSNIYENIEFVFDNRPNIISDFYLPIKLNLIGKKDDNSYIGCDVYSHQKALKQCSNFIEKNNLRGMATESTSSAQNLILNMKNCFAIGADIIDDTLEIKQENIGNYNNNKTRFIIVSFDNNIKFKSNNRKISFLCKLPHKIGSLLSLLNVLKKENINMTKIESKPIPNSNFEYLFMIEGEKNDFIEKNKIKDILNKNTIDNKILGVY